jgi:hypothetical protein
LRPVAGPAALLHHADSYRVYDYIVSYAHDQRNTPARRTLHGSWRQPRQTGLKQRLGTVSGAPFLARWLVIITARRHVHHDAGPELCLPAARLVLDRDAERLEHARGQALFFMEQSEQQGLGADVTEPEFPCLGLREHHNLTSSFREPLKHADSIAPRHQCRDSLNALEGFTRARAAELSRRVRGVRMPFGD